MKISDRELRGRPVIGADGRVIGEVAGITIDSESLGISTLEVELRRSVEDELGVRHRRFHAATITVPFASIQSIGETVVLAVASVSLRAAPEQPEAVPASP